MSLFLGILFFLLTIFIYIGAKKLYERYHYPCTFPLLIATIVLVSLLLLFNIPYDTYYLGGQWIEQLLGPAVVALAYPLYKQIHMLKQFFFPIIIGVMTGSFIGVFSGIWLAQWFGFEKEVIFSMLPKSVTTPVAMEITQSIGGLPPLTAILVMFAGLGGAVIAPYTFRLFNVTNDLARGIGTGTASHAIGTAKALENGEREGALSSVAMTLSAIFVSIIGPVITFLLY
ncbi:LrgB family protein [Halalkalibacter urbisdiaboli]|uniref:LrgB family protein n=1 Tax=Halalkalibacter urbisdiaboli TaxID=1960589 RepID=UPI000B442629|nr:LrgB family protein [Halalkalibacter urbisdiaboli]